MRLASLGVLLVAAWTGQAGEILKIGAGQLREPASLQAAPSGDLLVLDQRGNEAALVRFAPDGRNAGEVAVPAEVKRPQTAASDSSGAHYILAEGKAWVLPPQGKAEVLEPGVSGLTVKKTKAGEHLYLLKGKEVLRVATADKSRQTLPLSATPGKGGLSSLHVRQDGHLYAYSDSERLVYHFDAEGKLVEKFGSGGDIRCGVPAGCVGPHFDVDDQGEIYWTLADYGTLMHYTADGKTGVQFNGQEAWNAKWTGPIHTLCGFALSGGRAYELDRQYKRLTSFPKDLVAPGAKDCDTVNTQAFGLNFQIRADRPYKLFLDEKAVARVVFDAGNRRLHNVTLDYELFDLWKRSVAKGRRECELPGEAGATFDLPLPLPKLGWYELDAKLLGGGELLMERVVFLGRIADDPGLPLPEKESSGWADMPTHKAMGMGLHRFHFSPDPKEFDQTLKDIEEARKRGIPFFIQITDKKNCTPENVKLVLEKVPDLPALEIVNELNTSPADYVKLLAACHGAAKKANPKVRVLGPAQCGTELGWFQSFFKAGGGKYVDGVSVHTYMRHNSMDPYHWLWKLPRLREVMAANGCGDTPLYQTEHGFMADYHGHCLRHRWQGRAVFLEYLVLDRFGMWPDKHFYYYLNQGGFAGFSSYLVNDRRETFPAALLLRTRASLLGDRKYTRALSFGQPGDWLVLGNVYESADSDLVILVNCGAYLPVEVELTLPASAKALDCFGNPLPLAANGKPARLGIERYPTYLLVPHGAAFSAAVPGYGANLAPEAKVVVEDPEAQKKTAFLTNGALEFDFADEPERDGFRAKAGNLPLDVTLQFDAPRKLSRVVLYGSLADNDKCTPVDYELHLRVNGAWRKVDEIHVPVDGRVTKLEPLIKRVTWYDDPWIFTHQLEPVEADAVRFHFISTTFGQWPVREVMWGPLPQRVHLREVQVFGPPAK